MIVHSLLIQAFGVSWINISEIFIYLLFFSFFSLLIWTILSIFFPSEVNLKKRLKGYSRQKIKVEKSEERVEGLLSNPILLKGKNIIAKATENKRITLGLDALLQKAGLPIKTSEFIFIHFLVMLVSILFGLIIAKGSFVITALFALFGAFLPIGYLYLRKNQYIKKIHQQLPDTLDLIAGSLKAGYSFLQSLKMVVEETSPPIQEQFQKVILEARLGLPLDKALDNLTMRVDSENLEWTIMAVKIQKEVGGNLAEVLETLASTIRERDRISRQVKVLTAEGRLSAIILFLLPFLLAGILAIINPGYLSNLFKNTIGYVIVSGSLLLMLFGGLWLRKIVSIEV